MVVFGRACDCFNMVRISALGQAERLEVDAMSTEKMREEFEAWYLGKFCGGKERLFRCVNADQVYYFAEVQSKWDAWQASRAAIEVELPGFMEPKGMEPSSQDWQNGGDEMRARCWNAIESLGLKVKGG
jgi:hypothetical protein